MVQIRYMAFRPMIFQFKTHATLMDDFQAQVRTDFHLVELAADVIAVNHGRPPTFWVQKRRFAVRRAPVFCCFLTLSFYHRFDSYLLLSFKISINFRIHAARIRLFNCSSACLWLLYIRDGDK